MIPKPNVWGPVVQMGPLVKIFLLVIAMPDRITILQ